MSCACRAVILGFTALSLLVVPVRAAELKATHIVPSTEDEAGYIGLLFTTTRGEFGKPVHGREPWPPARAFSAPGRDDVYLVLTESAGSRVDLDERHVLARYRGDPPGEIAIDCDGKRTTFALDWSRAEKEDLRGRWIEAARSHFVSMGTHVKMASMSRHALSRLDALEGRGTDDPRRPSFLRAQALRRRSASAFDLTTGAVAIEESLQLQRLRGTGRKRNLEAKIPLSTLRGVTIRSHPWKEMLDGRDPSPHAIERFLPLDSYAFEARTFGDLIELADWVDGWGSPLVHVMEQNADDSRVKERLERQICLPASVIARKLGPLVIGRVAATGSDPFLREGSDLTLVFELKVPDLFFANLEKNRLQALATRPGTRRVEKKHGKHTIQGVVSDHRTISSWSVRVESFGLVSNSLVGLERALDAFDGKIPSQDEGLDRKFIRTLLPRGAKENVFVYLSDPCIRRLVSPGLKLRESRRIECSTSLRTIAHATAWRAVRGAKPASSFQDLVKSGDLAREQLFCPDGGHYELVDKRSGACSVHGTLEFLTPNVELPLDFVTTEEKRAYEGFRRTYESYWSQFFDPIGMQVTLGTTKRVETIILPLIEMSEYREFRDLFGGKGSQKGPVIEAGKGTGLFLSAHLNRESQLFRMAELALESNVLPGVRKGVLGWVGDRISFFAGDAPAGFSARGTPDPFQIIEHVFEDAMPGGIRIEVRNKLLLAGFLGAVMNLVTTAAPGAVTFESLPEYKGTTLVRIAENDSRRRGVWQVFYGIIGDGLYVAINRDSLHQIIDRHVAARDAATKKEATTGKAVDGKGSPKGAAGDGAASTVAAKAESADSWVDGTHIAMGLNLEDVPRWRSILIALYDQQARRMCGESLRVYQQLERLGLADVGSKHAFLGGVPGCPCGGEIARAEDGVIHCSAHAAKAAGNVKNPLRTLQRLRTSLTFTDDGVRTVLEVKESPVRVSAATR